MCVDDKRVRKMKKAASNADGGNGGRKKNETMALDPGCLVGKGVMAVTVVKAVVRALRGDRSTEGKRAGASVTHSASCYRLASSVFITSPLHFGNARAKPRATHGATKGSKSPHPRVFGILEEKNNNRA